MAWDHHNKQVGSAEENWRHQNAGSWRHCGPVCIVRWSDKKTGDSDLHHHTAAVQTAGKRRKEKWHIACMIHYNKHIGDAVE